MMRSDFQCSSLVGNTHLNMIQHKHTYARCIFGGWFTCAFLTFGCHGISTIFCCIWCGIVVRIQVHLSWILNLHMNQIKAKYFHNRCTKAFDSQNTWPHESFFKWHHLCLTFNYRCGAFNCIFKIARFVYNLLLNMICDPNVHNLFFS